MFAAAAVATSNSGAEAAMEWVLGHLEDADINDPLPEPEAAAAAGGAAAAAAGGGPDPEQVSLNCSMSLKVILAMGKGFGLMQGCCFKLGWCFREPLGHQMNRYKNQQEQ